MKQGITKYLGRAFALAGLGFLGTLASEVPASATITAAYGGTPQSASEATCWTDQGGAAFNNASCASKNWVVYMSGLPTGASVKAHYTIPASTSVTCVMAEYPYAANHYGSAIIGGYIPGTSTTPGASLSLGTTHGLSYSTEVTCYVPPNGYFDSVET